MLFRSNKDAKYTVKRAGVDGWAVHLVYTVSSRARELLTTSAHPDLVEMVNNVKRQAAGVEGGAFYINEFSHVLVPTNRGTFFAGRYSKELKFVFEGESIAPTAPANLRPGDEWPGPHVGILHRVTASTDDLYYILKLSPTRTEKVMLSDDCGKPAAARLAGRLARVKGEIGRAHV